MVRGPLADRRHILSKLFRPQVARHHAALQEHPRERARVRVHRVAAPDPHRQESQEPKVFLESEQPLRGGQASVERSLQGFREKGHGRVNREGKKEERVLREVVDPGRSVFHRGEHAIR